MKANKAFKSTVFASFFSDPKRLVEVYNAVEGTDYAETTQVEINTLEDALYKDRINDISFVLDGQFVVLMEHQSTVNENMPLRMLLYMSRVYEKILTQSDTVVYQQKRIPIPTPKFIVLYNGSDDCPEYVQYALSDSFINCDDAPMLELKTDVYNINYGKSEHILGKSRSLKEYSFFIHLVREKCNNGMLLEDAIKESIQYCVEHDVMQDYLKDNGSEVVNMLYAEWNMEKALNTRYKEGRMEGRMEGRKEGRAEGINLFLEILPLLGKKPDAEIMGMMGVTEQELQKAKEFKRAYNI